MNSRNILITIFAVFFGLFAGQGIISTSKAIFSYIKNSEQEQSTVTVDLSTRQGGPEEEIVYIEKEERNLFSRNISITTKYKGYNRLDEDYLFPNISANKVLISDIETGEVVEFSDQINNIQKDLIRSENQPIASITKLMTALVAWENLNHDDTIIFDWDSVATYGQQGGFSVGDKVSVIDTIHALLLQSSNDGAEALARHYGRDSFMKLMNDRATSIGMNNTFYNDPSGLSALNVSSLNDLMTLTTYMYRNYPEILEITDLRDYRSDGFVWYNNSRFRNDDNYLGGKNGYTDEAKSTLVSIFELPLGENSEIRKIAIIILGSESAEEDMRKIVFYLLKNIEYVK
jgi:D-alanyl-D-alanine carboxypeptidase